MPILNWLGRDKDIKTAEDVPYRLLEAIPELSYGDPAAENMLIQGDNLEGLKALLPYYAGQVNCIYIDPPYNTKSAFEYYDDNLEHTKWLSMMYPRLELLRELLADDGSIWISIDDNELGYLIVICDEIFGRRNRLSVSTFKQSSISGPKARNPGVVSIASYIINYAKNKANWKNKKVYTKRGRDSRYNKFIVKTADDETTWKLITLLNAFAEKNNCDRSELKRRFADKYEEKLHEFVLENSKNIIRTARVAEKDVGVTGKEALALSRENNNKFFKAEREKAPPQFFYNGEQVAFYNSKTQIIDGEVSTAEALSNIWSDILSNNIHNEGGVNFPDGKKPEALVKRILEVCTDENDLILDSFMGSATTAATAHKMNRRYIGIEMGEHAVSHCQPRLHKVVDGEQEGISRDVKWRGGGGFKFYRLGEAVFDAEGQITHGIKFQHLAAHIWFSETKGVLNKIPDNSLLGVRNDTAYYLLYNGILGDKRPQSGNVLTNKILKELPPHNGPKVIYGESSRLGSARLMHEKIIFKQTPYDVKVR